MWWWGVDTEAVLFLEMINTTEIWGSLKAALAQLLEGKCADSGHGKPESDRPCSALSPKPAVVGKDI